MRVAILLLVVLLVSSAAGLAQYHWRFDLLADPISGAVMSDRQNELRDVDLLGRSFASAESRHSVASKLRKAGFDRWPDEKSGLRTALEGWGDADEYYVREARSLLESGTPLLAIRIHYDQNDNLRSAIGGYFPGLWSF